MNPPLINCSYRPYAHSWQRSIGREEGLQNRLSHLVYSCVHRAAPYKNAAPYLTGASDLKACYVQAGVRGSSCS